MFRKLDTSEGDILEFETKGKLTDEENEQAMNEVKRIIETNGKIRMLEYAVEMPKVSPTSIKEYLSFAKDNMKNIEKYALVSDSSIASGLVKASDPFTKANFRSFGTEDIEKARKWLRQSDDV
jgi:hypothetical protein